MRVTPVVNGSGAGFSRLKSALTLENATSVDMSGGGAAVDTSARVAPETFAHVRLLSKDPRLPREYIARVAWVDCSLGKRCRCGLEFLTKERQDTLLPKTLLQRLPQAVRRLDRKIIEQTDSYLVATYGGMFLT